MLTSVEASQLVGPSFPPLLSLALGKTRHGFVSPFQVHSPFLKTCLVGCERIGKTCLARALDGDEFNPESDITEGIVLREYLLKDMRLGEEEVQHSPVHRAPLISHPISRSWT